MTAYAARARAGGTPAYRAWKEKTLRSLSSVMKRPIRGVESAEAAQHRETGEVGVQELER